MSRTDRTALLGIVAAIAIGGLVAWIGSAGSARIGSVPVFALCAAVAFAVNIIAFVPSYRAGTERFYDLTGGVTYLSVVALGLALSPDLDARAIIVGAAVAVWAVRLSTFLFARVTRDGGDGRFDAIKTRALRFAMAWILQGLWVLFTVAAGLAAITAEEREPFGVVGAVGLVVWVVGFAIEVVADRQKARFRADPANRGRFITTGLWAWSRHPNYFGEIVLWTGVAVLAAPALTGWRWLLLLSPVFVFVLLTRISGVPLLERRSDARWGDDPAYLAYKTRTPVLIPRPPPGRTVAALDS